MTDETFTYQISSSVHRAGEIGPDYIFVFLVIDFANVPIAARAADSCFGRSTCKTDL
jgi:hypothetical protein